MKQKECNEKEKMGGILPYNTSLETEKNENKELTNNYVGDTNVTNDNLILAKSIKRKNSLKLYKTSKKGSKENGGGVLTKEVLRNLANMQGLTYGEEKNVEPDLEVGREKKNGVKKVTFPPNFVSIIDVESYKKYNVDNTCKDPFDDMEFIQNIRNELNNEKNKEKQKGKENIKCSCTCLIF